MQIENEKKNSQRLLLQFSSEKLSGTIWRVRRRGNNVDIGSVSSNNLFCKNVRKKLERFTNTMWSTYMKWSSFSDSDMKTLRGNGGEGSRCKKGKRNSKSFLGHFQRRKVITFQFFPLPLFSSFLNSNSRRPRILQIIFLIFQKTK